MSKILMKKKQKLSPRTNGQTILLLPAELKEHFNVTEKVEIEYYLEGKTIIIKVNKEAQKCT